MKCFKHDIEIYVLCENRTFTLATHFLDRFSKNRQSLSDEFPLPQYDDDPITTYTDPTEIMRVMASNLNEPYSLYWNTTDDNEIKTTMLFYLEDGGLVAGIVVEDKNHQKWFELLAKELNAGYGFVNFSSPPPETKSEFIETCKSQNQIRLVAGQILE